MHPINGELVHQALIGIEGQYKGHTTKRLTSIKAPGEKAPGKKALGIKASILEKAPQIFLPTFHSILVCNDLTNQIIF